MKPQVGAHTKKYNIMIVDDHPAVREGLALRISEQPDLTVLHEASSIATGLEAIRRQSPDVAVVDITLKDGNGLELIKAIHAYDDTIRILVCSMHDESFYAERAIRAGAMGYITKEHATSQIIEAIRRILSNKVYVSEKLAERLMNRSLGRAGLPDASPIETLSSRELEVFELLGEAIDTTHIAERLTLSPKTVETYRARVKEKLGIQTSAELIRRAVEWRLESK
jgi:DNA-binding NarL/FixJ family response regulator